MSYTRPRVLLVVLDTTAELNTAGRVTDHTLCNSQSVLPYPKTEGRVVSARHFACPPPRPAFPPHRTSKAHTPSPYRSQQARKSGDCSLGKCAISHTARPACSSRWNSIVPDSVSSYQPSTSYQYPPSRCLPPPPPSLYLVRSHDLHSNNHAQADS